MPTMSKTTRTLIVFILMYSLFSVMAANSDATVVKPLNLSQLTMQADLIFSGKVLATESRWDSTRSKIWTHVTFSVDEVIGGSFAEKEITLRLPGGAIEADNIRMRVDGVPEFRVGEEVLLFCSRDPKRMNPIIGWFQGRFKIRLDETLGQRVIEGKRAARLVPGKRVMIRDAKAPPAVTYKDFADEIRRVMESPAPKPKP